MYKLVKSFLFVVLLAAVICIPVFAKNNTDVIFSRFTVSPSSYSNNLGYRTKEDASPLYLYISSATNNRFNYVFTRAYGTGGSNQTCGANGNLKDHVTTYIGTQYSIRSLIYESYLTKGTLAFRSPNYLNSQTITGVWSVDSAGIYTYAD